MNQQKTLSALYPVYMGLPTYKDLWPFWWGLANMRRLRNHEKGEKDIFHSPTDARGEGKIFQVGGTKRAVAPYRGDAQITTRASTRISQVYISPF